VEQVGVRAARLWLNKTSRWAEQRAELVRVKVQGVRKWEVKLVKESVVKRLLATTPRNLFLFIVVFFLFFF
jgi:hypothetical protein